MAQSSALRTSLRREWQAFWLAVGFLSRIPMLVRIDYSAQLMNQSSLYFPLVGLLLGIIYAVLFAVLNGLWTPWICVILVTGFHLWITGAFHEDGLADSVDALGGGYSVGARLTIMKDSRIGTYGACALVMALLLKVALLAENQYVWLALAITPCIARLTPLILMRALDYVSDPDTSKSKPVASGFSTGRLMIAMVFVLVTCIFASAWVPMIILWAALCVALVSLLWGWQLKRDLGGYTGDALGASVVLTELALLLMLAA
ncbi:adenosylcobinamide-GDP ribazoletransferase [Marinobacter confluentis]|uniref:Adenosylcobinamide-GDP ribazoletransferase n=1 Tax=Marinobacter confluentis TaxID=1697557 RepID=A0A4Z1C021_9GAMM|nr:adenosylcobinamide-GDP ribazoletransferase [Marinobacter confluentis]TGN39283.1 adenosylcobinamide-GDP ribazoletransferase [Marinobacter confluentis]